MTTFYFNKEVDNDFKFLQEEEMTWLPLSPPLNKKEAPVSSSNHMKVSGVNTNNNTWHSLWFSSTWQNGVVVDEPNTETSHSIAQRRGRSLSLLPPGLPYYTTTTADVIPSPLHSNTSTGFMINHNDKSNNNSIWSFNKEEERRHSIAYFSSRPITPPLQQQESVQQLIQQLQRHQQQQINEYFSPTTTTMDVQYLGKGVPIDQIKASSLLIYQIQFKENYRTDYYYQQEEALDVQLNDMVIVEADRGYDLGKVVAIIQDASSITSPVKRIFRHANPAELSTHALKNEDEQKALIICQAKIKQKNLNMQVIDAEYQW